MKTSIKSSSFFDKNIEYDLYKLGVNIIIFNNHILKYSYKSMIDIAHSILTSSQENYELNDYHPLNKIIDIIE